MREKASSVYLIILLSCVLVIQSMSPNLSINPARAQSIPNLCVGPPETVNPSLGVGQWFIVSLNISNLMDPDYGLYGWEAKITFNPEVVNCTSRTKITQGPFLTDWFGEGETTFQRIINYKAGYLLVACSKGSPPYTGGGALGSGILAYINFTVIANDRASLLQFADLGGEGGTFLRTAVVGVLAPIEPFTTQDGSFDNRQPQTNVSPVAAFEYRSMGTRFESGRFVEGIEFNASASYDPDAWLERYDWDYGDGIIESYIYTQNHSSDVGTEGFWPAIVHHAYGHAGIYIVKLVVTDNDGATAVLTRVVEVPGHDIAITELEAPYLAVMPGTLVPMNVNVSNNGNYTETFDVGVYFNETLVETKNIIDMPAYSETTLMFTWNTTEVALGKYVLKANASEVSGEIDISNNAYIDGVVTIASSNLVQFQVTIGSRTFAVQVDSTSIAEDLNFSPAEKRIDFSLTGALGWFSNVTIPMTLLNVSSPNTWIVKLNGDNITYTATSNGTHYFIYFDYVQSAEPYTVSIIGETVATPPVALFTVSKTLTIAGEPITFDASTSYDPDGTIESWDWIFGDGDIGTGEIVQHSFATNGTYSITLTVKDDEDLANSTQATISVTVAVHDIALTSLTATPNTVRIGETVTIQLTASNKGNFTESFTITAYHHDTVADIEIETRSITNLASKDFQLLTVLWNTTNTGPGTYTIKVQTSTILEETKTEDNTLTGVTVTVQKRLSILTADASSIVVTLGSSTTILGTLSPTLQGKTITIQYRLEGQSWGTLGTTTTDAQSNYQFLWTPTSTGTYEIQATSQGDANTEACQSEVRVVTVKEAESQGIPMEYIVATSALIVIVIAAAVYLLRFRKR